MAGRWFERKRQEPTEWTGFVEPGVHMEGKLKAPGTFRMDGTMNGSIVSDGTLVLGERASVQGEIIGDRVIIGGRFDGVIQAKSRVEIQASGVVTGEVHAPCLVMEPGALFDGQCHMLAATEAAKPITIPIRSAVGPSSR